MADGEGKNNGKKKSVDRKRLEAHIQKDGADLAYVNVTGSSSLSNNTMQPFSTKTCTDLSFT